MADAKITLEVGAQLNKQDLNQLNKDFENLLRKLNSQVQMQTDPKIRQELNQQIQIVEKMAEAYEKAFDNKTGQVNIQRMTQEMKNAQVSVQQFYNTMGKVGREGVSVYDKWANSILNANIQLKQSNQLLDRMAVTLKNTIRYGISSSIFNNFTNSVQKAYNFTKNLDTSLNDIRIVSNQSADQMERLAVSANRAAKELGKTTLDYTKAATIYYQQGLSSDEVEKRTQATLKAANVTGQNAQEVSEQLTAVWNGYRVTGEELELYVDKLAAVAAHSASDLEELSTGMSKVASAANLMGVNVDQLNAQMSTIISVTRQAPESVGTALRTIYARMADIKSGLDDETSLGNYSGKMKKLGFDVLDSSNNLKDMGVVIEEVGNKWKNLSREQQVALAQTMAGTRQYNNLLTLFDNWDKYTDALETSQNAAGELQKQQDIYMQSTAAHLEQLQATAEETYSALFDQETARDFIDLVTGGLSTINKYLNGLNTGALGGVLGQLGTLGANLFSSQIASGISTGLANRRAEVENLNKLELQEDILSYGARGIGKSETQWNVEQEYYANRKQLLDARKGLGIEEYQKLVDKSREVLEAHSKIADQLEDWKRISGELPKLEEKYKAQLQEIDSLEAKRKQNSEGLTESEEQRLNTLKQEAQAAIDARNTLEGLDIDNINKYQEGTKTIQDAVQLGNEQQRINDIIRGTTALLGTWNNLMTGINLITDDNLSSWEKFQGLVGVAGTQLILLLTSYESLTNLMPSLIIQTGAYTTEQFAEAAVTAKVVEEKTKELTVDQIKETIEKMSLATKIKLLAIKLKEWVVEKGRLATDKAALIIGNLINVSKTIETAKRAANTAAINGENVALAVMKALLGDISGLGIVAAVAIGAVAVAMGSAIMALVDANTGINGYNKAIEEAQKHTQEVKDAYNELKETMTSYKDARNGIDQLTLGTLEYYDAVLKANEEAQKLIDKMHLIAGEDYTIGDGGLIQIDDEKLEELQFKEQQKVYRASAAENEKRLQKAQYRLGQSGQKLQNAINEYPKSQSNSSKTSSGSGGGHIIPNLDDSYDITKWDLEEKAVYSQAFEEAQAIKRTLADQIIRGYASKADVEIYSQMNSEGQRIAQDFVAKQAEQSSVNMGAYNLLDTIIGEHSKIPVMGDIGKWFGKTLTDITPDGPLGGIISTYFGGGYGARASLDKELREQYASEELGYEKRGGLFGIGGRWYKKDSEIDVTDEVDQLDAREIATLKESGAKGGQKAAEQIVQIYSESLSKSAEAGFGETSQKYIANARMALKTGQSVDYSMMNGGERQQFLSQLNTTESVAATIAMNQEENAYNPAKRQTADLRDFNDTLEAQATSLDTTTSALKMYGLAMQNAGELTAEQNAETADAIAASYKFNKAYNNAIKVYKNNTDAIDDYVKAIKNEEQVSYETADAMGELYDQLKGIFGDKLSPKLLVDNMDLVKQLLTGTEEEAEEAYRKLESLNIQNVLTEQFGDEAINKIFGTKEALADFANHISNLDFGQSIGNDYFQKLKQMVNTSQMTKEEVESLFASMNLKTPPLKITNQKVKIPGETVHHDYNGTAFAGTDIFGNPKLVHVEYGWDETTQPTTKNFVTIGDNVKAETVTSTVGGGNYKKAPSNTKTKKSGSTAKPSKKDPNKQELDRYQLVNVQLKEISKELTKLDKQKKKLLGGNLVKNLNQQIKLLNDQIDVTEAKLKIAEKERAETAKTLSGYGAKFDVQGNVYNYETIFKQEQARLNKVYAKYNKMSKPQQEKYESTVKAAEERFKKFNDTISRYNTLNSDFIPGLEQDIIDAQDKITEDLIEEFNMEIKVRLDLADAKREWNEFTRKYLKGWKENDVDKWASGVIDDLSLLINGNEEEGFGGTLIEATNQLSKFQAEFEKITSENKAGDWYRDNAAQFKEDWKDAIETAQEEYKRLQEAQDKMNEYFLQAMDLTQEKFDEQLDNFEAINKQIEHNLSLIDLLYGEDSYDKIEEQQKASRDNSIEQLAYLKQQKDYYDDLLATLNEEDEAWQEAKNSAQAANEALMEGLTDALEKAKEAFESGVAAVIKDMTDTLTNGKGFDLINKQWELMNENSQLELDNINRMQGLQDIAKKYNDAINNTSNVKAQKELAEIRDKELEQLKEIDHLSQEDLERAEKKLEIAKAQIALEDAQQNKTQMRLRRDSQGNYRYQFVANEDQVNQAKDQLAAAYNSLYNFDKERALQNNQEMISTTQQYFEEIANLRIRYGDDEEKYKEEKRILDEQYNEKMAILEEHRLLNEKNLNESTFADLNNLYAQNANNYELMTDAQKAALNSFEAANQTAFDLIFGLETENTEAFRSMADEEKRVIEEELIPQWNSGVDEMINKLADEGGFEQVATGIWNNITEKIKDYFEAIEAAEETSGRTFDELLGSENSIINQNKEWIESNKDLIQTFIDMTGSVEEFYNELSKIIESYGDIIEKSGDVIKTNQDLYDQFTTEEADSIRDTLGTEPTTGGTGAFNQPVETTPTTTTKTTSTKPSIPFDGTLPKGTQLYNASGGKYNKTQAARTVTVTAAVGSRYQVWGSTFNPHTVYIDKNAIKYDTGGYTGEWGNGGRLALLHQKELVLNRKDTANMLNAVEVLRGITDNIGADLLGRMANITAGGFSSAVGGNALEQNVHIEATFPGVKSSIEIQDALNNLVNMAAQRAQTR